MIHVVVDRPYQFIPPYPGTFWLRGIKRLVPWYLRRSWGIETTEFRGGDRLEASLNAGHGVLIAPNHARPCDPFVIGLLPLRLGRPCHFLAAWHIFTNDSRLNAWLLRRVGAFSIHRWGMDRESLKTSIQILTEAKRPLMLFPEGMITRANDRLGPLLDGTAFIARSAARHRARLTPPGQVVVHPVGIRYFFDGDVRQAVDSVLEKIERRISWQPQRHRRLIARVLRAGHGLLALRELEYPGEAHTGPLGPRLRALIEAILEPIEQDCLKTVGAGPVVERVKRIRTAILPDLIRRDLPPEDRARHWRHLEDCYLAQQLDCYPEEYLATPTTVERILETVERYEEDLTDTAQIHRPLKAVVQFGEAITIDPASHRKGDDELTGQLEHELKALLAQSRSESRVFAESTGEVWIPQ